MEGDAQDIDQSQIICKFLSRTGKCTYPKCHFSHDITDEEKKSIRAKFLAMKEQKRKEAFEAKLIITPSLRAPGKPRGYQWFNDVLGKPRFMCAPMVDQSELAFRNLVERYGVDVSYSPMLHANNYLTQPVYRKVNLSTSTDAKPLLVQFCGNKPDIVLASAKLVEDRCEGVDLNLGCPQRIASRGRYGAFLMEEWDTIRDIVHVLDVNLGVPVSVKIRVLDDREKTIQYAKMIESAGAQMLGVHGRTREMIRDKRGNADWDTIKAVKEALSIPVVCNGNIGCYEDAIKAMEYTGCDAVMSAEGLLADPALFVPEEVDRFALATEYLTIARELHTPMKFIRTHIQKMFRSRYMLQLHCRLKTDFFEFQNPLGRTRTIDDIQQILNEIEQIEKGGGGSGGSGGSGSGGRG